MSSRLWRALVALLLAGATLWPAWAAPGGSAWAAALEQQAPVAPASGHGVRAVESGWNFLLDRYTKPLGPAPLAQAAWDGALDAAGEALKAGATKVPFAAERGPAWDDLQGRLTGLIAAGADADAVAQGANRGMARSLDDCHTRFATSYDKEISAYDGGEKYGGIGASALDASRFDPRPPAPVIVSLVDGGPAARAGLKLGDAVIGVDSTDTTGWSNSRVVDLVRGEAGTTVQLTVQRPGSASPLTIPVVRSEIQSTLVESRYIPPTEGAEVGGIGYVQLKGFARAAEPEVPQAIEALYAQGARYWVLDLRNNGGGSVPTFAAIASLFIKDGTLGVTTDRNGAESVISTIGMGYHDYAQPVAVLVNSLSASASELLAADLQEYGAGRVFGETTAGCFGNSQLFRLPDGSALWITVRALQSGLAHRDVHKLGVTPDEVVPRTRDDLASGRDPQLEAALGWLATSAMAAHTAQ